MISLRNALRQFITTRNSWNICVFREIHATPLVHGSFSYQGRPSPDSSLWFTTLPKVSKTHLIRTGKKRTRKKPVFMPPGKLLISCKRKEFNHYKGVNYKKIDSIPLASKGWMHKKSAGDYFTILPTNTIPAFLPLKNDKETGNAESESSSTFKSLGLSDKLVERLETMGMTRPTSIQIEAIPPILSGKHVLMAGETGCGKTLAYSLPMVEHILKWKPKLELDFNRPLGLVVVPTRELATQVGGVITKLIEGSDLSCKVVLASRTKRFLMNLSDEDVDRVDIVISTPGVMSKLTYHNVYNLTDCIHLIADEADTLLDDSFCDSLERILMRSKFRLYETEWDETEPPNGAQLTFASATMPTEVNNIVNKVFSAEALHVVSTRHVHRVPAHITQNFMRCRNSDKHSLMLDLVKQNLKEKKPVMLFSNVTKTCNWLAHYLRENGIECARYNSRMSNKERLDELERFRTGEVNVMTCTDIASRGHDIPRVKQVINYEFPFHMADYVHRCGRTGRIGNEEDCHVTSLISTPAAVPLLNRIEMSARYGEKLDRVIGNTKRLVRARFQAKLMRRRRDRTPDLSQR